MPTLLSPSFPSTSPADFLNTPNGIPTFCFVPTAREHADLCTYSPVLNPCLGPGSFGIKAFF